MENDESDKPSTVPPETYEERLERKGGCVLRDMAASYPVGYGRSGKMTEEEGKGFKKWADEVVGQAQVRGLHKDAQILDDAQPFAERRCVGIERLPNYNVPTRQTLANREAFDKALETIGFHQVKAGLIRNEIVAVQPMKAPEGMIFQMDYKYGERQYTPNPTSTRKLKNGAMLPPPVNTPIYGEVFVGGKHLGHITSWGPSPMSPQAQATYCGYKDATEMMIAEGKAPAVHVKTAFDEAYESVMAKRAGKLLGYGDPYIEKVAKLILQKKALEEASMSFSMNRRPTGLESPVPQDLDKVAQYHGFANYTEMMKAVG